MLALPIICIDLFFGLTICNVHICVQPVLRTIITYAGLLEFLCYELIIYLCKTYSRTP